jgi:hypothetical protein
MTNTTPEDKELRKLVEDSIRVARMTAPFALGNEVVADEDISIHLETIMTAIHAHDKALLASVRPENKQTSEWSTQHHRFILHREEQVGAYNAALADYDQNIAKYLEENS